MRFNKCPLCLNLDYFDNKLVEINGIYKYLICKHCGGGIIQPWPSKNILNKLYQSKKYFKYLAKPMRNLWLQYLLTRKIYKTSYEYVDAYWQGKKDVVDIGCGNGEFLEELKKKGWIVYGVDVSNIAINNTGKKIGKDQVFKGDFEKIKFNKKFGLVSFWHVLEHVESPSTYLSRAFRITSDNGGIVGEVPNFDSFWLKIFKKSYSGIMVPEHILYFSKNSLEVSLKKAGFKNLKVWSTNRGLLTFSLSLNKLLLSTDVNKLFVKIITLLSIPISIIFGILVSSLDKGEVLRFMAVKDENIKIR